MMQWLHEQGVPLNVADEDGDQPIHCAAGGGHLAIIQWLHERGVPLDVAGNDGTQAIHAAAVNGHLAIIQWLHERGVPLDVANTTDDGRQPIHYAAMFGQLAIIQWFHKRGVPLDVASDSGRQPIDFALRNSHRPHHQAVVKWLREQTVAMAHARPRGGDGDGARWAQ